jgi:hypothetical protein
MNELDPEFWSSYFESVVITSWGRYHIIGCAVATHSQVSESMADESSGDNLMVTRNKKSIYKIHSTLAVITWRRTNRR